MNALSRLTQFVLEQSGDQPARVRAQLYADLAALHVDEADAAELLRLSAECRAIDRDHSQLELNFRARNKRA